MNPHELDFHSRASASHAAAGWLSLAAAPTFAAMALLTGFGGGGTMDMPCMAVPDAPAVSGMAPMYLLMAAFHLPPWLRLLPRPAAQGKSRHTCNSHRSAPRP